MIPAMMRIRRSPPIIPPIIGAGLDPLPPLPDWEEVVRSGEEQSTQKVSLEVEAGGANVNSLL